METQTCGFCHRGASPEIEEICGKLHVEKIDGKYMGAHHKCLQYSAQLVQYKFDNFGGFKIDRVTEEMRRGRFMKCHICKTNPGKVKNKNKDGYSINGATAGCALKNCKKTFHYICAFKDHTAITKRLKINYKEKGIQVVMYRVFCCGAHEQEFKSNKSEFYRMFQTGGGSSSEDEEEGGDENDNASDSDEEEKNNNSTATKEKSNDYDRFLDNISILSQASPDVSKSLRRNLNKSLKEDGESSSKTTKQNTKDNKVNGKAPKHNETSSLMFDDEDEDEMENGDDSDMDLSPQLSSLYEDIYDDDKELPSDGKNKESSKSTGSSNILSDTPNSIKVKAQINHVPESNSTRNSKGTKKSLKYNLREEESSGDEIKPAPPNRSRLSRRCSTDISFSSKTPSGGNRRKARKISYSSDTTEEDDFVSEKDLKKKHKKFLKSIEKKKPVEDDSPTNNNSSPTKNNSSPKINTDEQGYLSQQVVLNIKPVKSSEKGDNTPVDVEGLESKNGDSIQNKCVIRSLTVQLNRISSDYKEITPSKDKNEKSMQIDNDRNDVFRNSNSQETDSTGKKQERKDCKSKRQSSSTERPAAKKSKLSDSNSDDSNQSSSTVNCYLHLESDTCGSSTETEMENSKYNTCGLILTQDLECCDSIRTELLKQAEKELGVKEDNLAFWLDAFKLENLQKEIMPHLMNDIGQKLCAEEGDKGKIATLLTTADKLHSQLPNYSYVLNLYKSMDKSLVQNMQDNVYKQLRNNLSSASKKYGYTVGKLLTVQKVNALILTVNDKLDPKGLIRKKMSHSTSDKLFQCSVDTRFHMLNRQPSKLQTEDETLKIVNFIREEFDDFVLQVVPSDPVLKPTEDTSCSVKSVSTSLKKIASDDSRVKNHVLCLCPMDKNVVNTSSYCKKMLAQFLWQTSKIKNSQIIAVIHLDSCIVNIEDIISSIVLEEQELTVLLAHDPAVNPVSCAVVTGIPYNEKKQKVCRKVVAPEIKDARSTPRQHLPLIRITKEVTKIIRSSPRKTHGSEDNSGNAK